MRVETIDGDWWVVRRGVRYFGFFVDGTGSSWSKFTELAHKHKTKKEAEQTVEQLKLRARAKRRKQ